MIYDIRLSRETKPYRTYIRLRYSLRLLKTPAYTVYGFSEKSNRTPSLQRGHLGIFAHLRRLELPRYVAKVVTLLSHASVRRSLTG